MLSHKSNIRIHFNQNLSIYYLNTLSFLFFSKIHVSDNLMGYLMGIDRFLGFVRPSLNTSQMLGFADLLKLFKYIML